VGEIEGAAEEGWLEPTKPVRVPDGIAQTMKVTLEGALSLLRKYAEERTPVLAAFVTPSVLGIGLRSASCRVRHAALE
jgi:hypothetical protein